MSSKITVSGHHLSKTQIGVNKYRISDYQSDKMQFQFNVSLQATDKDDVLPTYQLTDETQTIPEWTMENLNVISDWITKETK